MFIVLARKESRTWISGIFGDRKDAESYFDSISEVNRIGQEVIEVHKEYPFYIIERDKTFIFCNKTELLRELNQLHTVEDPDRVRFNLYFIESDYKPKVAGTDYMGILKHDHIDNDFMKWFRKEGKAFLKRRRLL